jgi:hypothetical protein
MLTTLLVLAILSRLLGPGIFSSVLSKIEEDMELDSRQKSISRQLMPAGIVLVVLAVAIGALYIGVHVSNPDRVPLPDYRYTDTVYVRMIDALNDSITQHRERYERLRDSISHTGREGRSSSARKGILRRNNNIGGDTVLYRYMQVADRHIADTAYATPEEFLRQPVAGDGAE